MAFLGMRGTGDWTTDERPKSWREGILYYWPNGTAPLTAIMSKLSSKKVTDPEFNWWTKALPAQNGDVTDVYTDSGLSTAYASGGAAGNTLYVKLAEATANEFRAGHIAVIRTGSDITKDRRVKVTASTAAGASSYLTVKLLEADTGNALAGASLKIFVAGSANAEGADRPSAIAYDPVKLYNLTQIFRTPLEITRTAMETTVRTGDPYNRMKKEALELHSIEMEKAFLFGVRTEGTGTNGKPERTTDGIIQAIRDNASGNILNFTAETGADWAGKTWANAGWDYVEYCLEQLFSVGEGKERLALCGPGYIRALGSLVRGNSSIELTAMKEDYGVRVTKWHSNQGTLNLLTHPLFRDSYIPGMSNSAVVIDPSELSFRFITDTTFKGDKLMKQGGGAGADGTKEEFLTEAGLEYGRPQKLGFLTGFGSDNEN